MDIAPSIYTPRAGAPVRCAFVGDEPLVVQCAEIAQAHGLLVALVATANELVAAAARETGVPVVEPAQLGVGLDEHPADVLFSIANLRIVRQDVLDRVTTAVNFHDGPLPAYAGLNVTTWALLAGEREHAVTWHLMTDRVDEGDVVEVERFTVEADESAFSLNARCYEAALASFPRVAAAIAAGTLRAAAQPDGVRRMFGRYDRPARLFDPTSTAAEQVRVVRALDLGHRLRNTIGCVRLLAGANVLVIEQAATAAEPSGAPAGTIVSADQSGLQVATSDGDVVVVACCTPAGVELDGVAALDHLGLAVGAVLAPPDRALADAITELEPLMARDEAFWLDRVAVARPSALPWDEGTGAEQATATVDVGGDEASAVAAIAAWLARVSGSDQAVLAVTTPTMRELLGRTAPLSRPPVVPLDIDASATFADLAAATAARLDAWRSRRPLLADAVSRDPRTRGVWADVPTLVELDDAGSLDVAAAAALAFASGSRLHLAVRGGRIDLTVCGAALAGRLAEELATVLGAGLSEPARRCDALPIVGPNEASGLDALNATARDHDRTATLDAQFRDRTAASPDRPALSFGDRTLSYAELDAAVAALAARLADSGVERGHRVGIAVPRGIDMVVGVLATLELGAAYVPLDPTYPAERLELMVSDAGLRALLADEATAATLARPGLAVVDPAADADSAASIRRGLDGHDAGDVAYVIYTSGSTGVPKGVMLEHRQVTNFFAAMDDVIGDEPPGVWLAVTSLSFDISVLELLWTLTRGFHVVLKSDSGVPSRSSAPPSTETPRRPVSFSLFYFAAGEDTAADGYRLLLDSARFADRHGFEAVWTPERHFHAFGGAYPNPSVTGAALAAITSHVAIRAGSVVLPLHSPIRVAEEWAVVDNISRGRVGISFAAGWQPNDFVLNPSAYATAKEDLPRSIDAVQRLWRGEAVALPGHDGVDVEVRTLPRPVQAALPTWLTSAGSPSTFERAGKLGVNLLTHLLGQSVDQLAANIAVYRAAWLEAGHPGKGTVTLMMHTYLDVDGDTAREVAREPMKAYLGTAVGLLRDVASAFPTFAGRGKDTDDLFKSLSADELDQLLEVAAHRYLGSSGLFGTAADAAAMVETVASVGVDEVACLIDFGVETDAALASLELVLEAKRLVDAERSVGEARPAGVSATVADHTADSVAALVERHGATHLQCTPSLAAMLLADPSDAAALGDLGHLLVGGEQLPVALAAELRAVLPGRFTNMYGPTETTIWSLVHEIEAITDKQIPIGRPIANTTVFVLDEAGQRLPTGVFGELHIGGEGVARGYLGRDDLTAARFVARPGMGRVYATGDLARVNPAGYVEFAGRADNQVKIRGHRIELGEIEAVLDRHPDVAQSVVVARGSAADARLVGFVRVRDGADVPAEDLRKHVAATLPDVMVPALFVKLDTFPLTPNGKVDRNALPTDVEQSPGAEPRTVVPPVDDAERLVADVWESELDRPVGRDDNFFDIGGHSLLAVKVFRRLGDATSVTLALTDVFRYPTVRTFAAHLNALTSETSSDGAAAPAAVPAGADRGAMRRRALTRRESRE